MLAYARTGDVIVVHTLDRLGRNIRDVLNLIHDLAGRGIAVRSLADPLSIMTTDEGLWPHRVPAPSAVAEVERIFTAARAAHARSVSEANGPPARAPRRQDRVCPAAPRPGQLLRRDHRQDRHPERLAAPLPQDGDRGTG